jgi:hypothetical protein
MIRFAGARACQCGMLVMSVANSGWAGVWVTDPTLGLVADFSTNPALLDISHAAETHGAILIDLPTAYHANSTTLTVLPSFRISNSAGYSSLASDYQHLTVAGEIDAERDTVTASALAARDSSLYYNDAVNGSTGARRDSTDFDTVWIHAFTERLNSNVELNSSRVQYGPSTDIGNLTDYRYLNLTNYRYSSATPTLSWSMTELTSLTVEGGTGIYDSSNEETKSVNYNLGVGFKRQINELWNLTGNFGLSRQQNVISEYYGPYLLGTARSTTNGTVYSAQLTRKGPRITSSASASRALVPTGFSFLATQSTYQVGLEDALTERWTLAAHVRWLTTVEPEANAPSVEQTYKDYGLSAAWQLTEKWTVTWRALYLSARYSNGTNLPPPFGVSATGVDIQLSRRFDTIKWQ